MQYQDGVQKIENYVDNDLAWNVIDDEQFKSRVHSVFNKVAQVLRRTLGPYGATTVIEQLGQTHVTKDGWSVLKKITFNNPTENTILTMLREISAQVVSKVGDGSTSSIVSANEVLTSIESSEELKKIRPKELVDTLRVMSSIISERILEKSTKVDREHFDAIYRLAKVSTNGSEEIATMIRDIYEKTGNPTIDFRKSDASETYSEIIEGYRAEIKLTDQIYATHDNGVCKISNPIFVMFDHKITMDHYSEFIAPVLKTYEQSQSRIVVVAPGYDQELMSQIRDHANATVSSRHLTRDVYTLVGVYNNASQEDYADFAMLSGGVVITEDLAEKTIRSLFKSQAVPPEGVDRHVHVPLDMEEYIGKVEMAELSGTNTRVDGFIKRNENLYEIFKRDAQAKYEKVRSNQMEHNIVDVSVYISKKRVAKLECKMGMIHVGGRSALEREGLYDAIEDAVRAAESAFHSGYNIGGNLIIPIVIDEIIAEGRINETELEIMKLLRQAFVNVFKHVIANKDSRYATAEEVAKNAIAAEAIVERCINLQACYDLTTEQTSLDIINPALTDIEILKGTTSIVSLLVGSNQYLSVHMDSNVNK